MGKVNKHVFNDSYGMELSSSVIFWREYLFSKTLRMFGYEGQKMPDFKLHELEMRLLGNGFCGILKDDVYKKNIVTIGSISGVTPYWDDGTTFTYAITGGSSGSLSINSNKVQLCANTALKLPITGLVDKTAKLLAHTEISFFVSLINSRAMRTFKANGDTGIEAVKAWLGKLFRGKLSVIEDSDSGLEKYGIQSIMEIGQIPHGYVDDISKYLEIKNNLLRDFFRNIGIRWSYEKKGNMIKEEIEEDRSVLLINILDMLEQREIFCEEMSRKPDIGIIMKPFLNKEFVVIEDMSNVDKEIKEE